MPKPTSQSVNVMRTELERVLWIARERYSYTVVPSVDWSVRGNTVHGRATYVKHHIALNAATANAEGERFAPTVGHEVAHLVSYAFYGRKGVGHGPCWREVMRSFGLPPNRCTNYASAVQRATEARIRRGGQIVTCACGPRAVGPRVADNMARGIGYKCGRCKRSLIFNGGIYA